MMGEQKPHFGKSLARAIVVVQHWTLFRDKQPFFGKSLVRVRAIHGVMGSVANTNTNIFWHSEHEQDPPLSKYTPK
jgi:hypothetical protein